MSSDTTQTSQALKRQLASSATGRLTTRELTGSVVDVYLMNGDVLAAHAEDDERLLLRRLGVLGHLDDAQQLGVLHGDPDIPVEDRLYEVVPEGLLLEVLFGRFKDNLTRFLACTGPCAFTSMEAIFVTNLQFSHDTDVLLAEAFEVLDRTAGLVANPPDLVQVLPGNEGPSLPTEEPLVALVGSEGCDLQTLLAGSPFEPYESLDLLADMIRRGTVNTAVDLTDSDIEDISVISVVELQADLEDDENLMTQPPDERDDEEPEPVVPASEGIRFPRDLIDEPDVDDELAMFADHDQERGSLGDGHFVGAVRDRVDLSDVLVPDGNMLEKFQEPDDELLEMGSAEGVDLTDGPVAKISMKFTGPRLTNQEAERKLQVVNGVLSQLSTAFDDVGGSGGGQSQIQLLLDGSPAGFSLLFYQVEARRDGTMNPNAILHNLRRRPAAEHRRLLNTGLLDLIERALSAACESLDDDALDTVLESIAGYQQAIGL